ncbi:MAG: hypothetical protein AAGE98_11605 [Actinomycetota bacterium]
MAVGFLVTLGACSTGSVDEQELLALDLSEATEACILSHRSALGTAVAECGTDEELSDLARRFAQDISAESMIAQQGAQPFVTSVEPELVECVRAEVIGATAGELREAFSLAGDQFSGAEAVDFVDVTDCTAIFLAAVSSDVSVEEMIDIVFEAAASDLNLALLPPRRLEDGTTASVIGGDVVIAIGHSSEDDVFTVVIRQVDGSDAAGVLTSIVEALGAANPRAVARNLLSEVATTESWDGFGACGYAADGGREVRIVPEALGPC